MGKLYLTFGDFILNSNNMDAIVNAQNKYMPYDSVFVEWFVELLEMN